MIYVNALVVDEARKISAVTNARLAPFHGLLVASLCLSTTPVPLTAAQTTAATLLDATLHQILAA